MSAARKKPAAAVPATLRVAAQARGTNDTSSDARRAEIRRALADWRSHTSAMLMHISDSAADLHREATSNPDGELARELAGNVEDLRRLSGALSDAESYVAGLYMTPDFTLPDPLALVRKDGAA